MTLDAIQEVWDDELLKTVCTVGCTALDSALQGNYLPYVMSITKEKLRTQDHEFWKTVDDLVILPNFEALRLFRDTKSSDCNEKNLQLFGYKPMSSG